MGCLSFFFLHFPGKLVYEMKSHPVRTQSAHCCKQTTYYIVFHVHDNLSLSSVASLAVRNQNEKRRFYSLLIVLLVDSESLPSVAPLSSPNVCSVLSFVSRFASLHAKQHIIIRQHSGHGTVSTMHQPVCFIVECL